MGAVFEPFLNSGFNFAILQSDGNIEYLIDMLQIWEMGLGKTVASSFKNLPDRLYRLAALFSSKSWMIFNTVSSYTKFNLNLALRFFRRIVKLNVNQTSKKGKAN